MKLKELKELLEQLPKDFDDVEVLTCQIEANSYAFPRKLTTVLYSNTEVILESRYSKESSK
jgi:hypothetical protein